MIDSVIIVCDNSPIGKNSAAEAVRLGSGFIALGEIIDCEIIFRGDAVLLFSKHIDPTKVKMDPLDEVVEMADLSDLPISLIDKDLEDLGLMKEDLVDYENLGIISHAEMIKKIEAASTCFRI
ncbi:MAG: hypothetical protein GF317_18545 [Candidatus Lokiarchaeota archaeon]|nr:hypothetical protein [Candidatus Lokiarchaeota archaeon]MBD3201516.1 hypothetical protein [Candidatus Lokiarchaeota archaeon]